MPRVDAVEKVRHIVYLRRAQEFAQQMDRAAIERAWNAVGLLGVHSVISACDALSVQQTGKRWSGQGHQGALAMVRALNLPSSEPALRQIANVLEKKRRVEYESREFTEREAGEVQRDTARLLSWVLTRLT